MQVCSDSYVPKLSTYFSQQVIFLYLHLSGGTHTAELTRAERGPFLVRGTPSVLWVHINNPGRRQLEGVGEAHLSPGGANRLHLLLLGHQTEHTHTWETQWRERDSGQTRYCADMTVTLETSYSRRTRYVE